MSAIAAASAALVGLASAGADLRDIALVCLGVVLHWGWMFADKFAPKS